MANHEDDYFDESLDNEGPGNGIGDEGSVEGMEHIEDGPTDPPSPLDGYVPVRAEGFAGDIATPASVAAPAARSAEDEQFLSEIEKAQSKSRGVGALILTVLISGVLFVAAGTAWWSWELTLTLVPVLLIHELGHFVTMKSFKYRNVNMFFIPLLGAAVTGQQFNVPAWKKAMVALMGPVPSIFLATVVGIAALVLELDWLVYGCIVALFLNGLNLVPLLPFDGGHVLHAVLFCRHYYLDVALRVVTIVVLLALSAMFGHSLFLIGLAALLLLTIRVTIRHGQIAQQLRSEGDLELVTEDDRIAPATALRIVEALRARIKAKMTTRTLAQFTLQVVEQINTRPPGVLASIGFLFAHGTGLVVALLAGVGLGAAVNEDLREQWLMGLAPPLLYEYDCDASEIRGDQYVPTSSTKTVIATFATSAEAQAAYLAARPEVSSKDHLQWFGQSVTVALDHTATPQTLQSWIGTWEPEARELLVQSPDVEVFFSLDATFRDEALAARVDKEFRAYFENPYQYALDPPWQPGALVYDPAESEQYRARAICTEVAEVVLEAVVDDERASAAARIGDVDEVERFSDEITRDVVADLKASKPDIDTITIDLYLKAQMGECDKEELRQLIERMGGTFVDYADEYETLGEEDRIDEDEEDAAEEDGGSPRHRRIEGDHDEADDEATGGDDGDCDYDHYELNTDYERYGGNGWIVRGPKTVSLRGGYLNVTAEGAKAIADWLCALGAYDIVYAFDTYDE